jgi:hypothetical protein
MVRTARIPGAAVTVRREMVIGVASFEERSWGHAPGSRRTRDVQPASGAQSGLDP